jgi:DNA-directed RNA polymerase sigma subunit (sigma70/sigma32)
MAKPPDELCIDRQIAERAGKAFHTLTAKESFVVRASFGLAPQGCLNDREIGDMYGCTPQCIRGIRVNALKKLRRGSKMGKNDALPGWDLLPISGRVRGRESHE